MSRLTEFLAAAGSPLHYLAEDFLAAADTHNLDWRLLPSISIVESGGGKNYVNNNVFGWDCARARFRTVREGIYWVASRIAHSKLYRNKDLDAILTTYNPRAEWGALVRLVMQRVDPTLPLKPTVEAWVSPTTEPQSTGRLAPVQ